MSLGELANECHVADFLYVHNNRSVIEARNEILAAFLDSPHDTLLMVDDDVVPNPNLTDLAKILRSIDGAGIVGAPCPIALPNLPILPNVYTIDTETGYYAIDLKSSLSQVFEPVREVGAIGFGAVAIGRQLAESQPRFENRYDPEGVAYMGEDIDYCVRAREIGYDTYAAFELLCDHRMELHGAGMAKVFAGLLQGEIPSE